MQPLEVRQANRALLRAAKTKCEICGESDYCCLEMHHKENKQYNISKAVLNIPTRLFKKELSKCFCCCSNCHKKLHNKSIMPALEKS